MGLGYLLINMRSHFVTRFLNGRTVYTLQRLLLLYKMVILEQSIHSAALGSCRRYPLLCVCNMQFACDT